MDQKPELFTQVDMPDLPLSDVVPLGRVRPQRAYPTAPAYHIEAIGHRRVKVEPKQKERPKPEPAKAQPKDRPDPFAERLSRLR